MKRTITAAFEMDEVREIQTLANDSGRSVAAQFRYLVRLGLAARLVKAASIARAETYEREAAACHQHRSIPEGPLAKIKGQHWRILAEEIEREETKAGGRL